MVNVRHVYGLFQESARCCYVMVLNRVKLAYNVIVEIKTDICILTHGCI